MSDLRTAGPSRRLRGPAALLPLLLALAGCQSSASSPPQLLSQPGGTIPASYLTQPYVPTGQSVSYGGVLLCVLRPENAVIKSVAIHDAVGGLEVEAFAIRSTKGRKLLGYEARTLNDIADGFKPGSRQAVTEPCPTDGEAQTWQGGTELGIQVSRHTGDVAYGPGLDIKYESGGAEVTYTVPLGIMLCEATCPKPPGW
jgi:hypothetical protein